MEKRKLIMSTRWPIKQIGETGFEVLIPIGNLPILNADLIEALKLSDGEVERAEDQVLRTLVVLS